MHIVPMILGEEEVEKISHDPSTYLECIVEDVDDHAQRLAAAVQAHLNVWEVLNHRLETLRRGEGSRDGGLEKVDQ